MVASLVRMHDKALMIAIYAIYTSGIKFLFHALMILFFDLYDRRRRRRRRRYYSHRHAHVQKNMKLVKFVLIYFPRFVSTPLIFITSVTYESDATTHARTCSDTIKIEH